MTDDVLRPPAGARGYWPAFAGEEAPLAEAMAAAGEFALEVPASVASDPAPRQQGFGRITVRWASDGGLVAKVVSTQYAAPTRLRGRLEPSPAVDPARPHVAVLRGTLRNRTSAIYAWALSPPAALLLALGALAASGAEWGVALVGLGVGLALLWLVVSQRRTGREMAALHLVQLGNGFWQAATQPQVDGLLARATTYAPSAQDVETLLAAARQLDAAPPEQHRLLDEENHPATTDEIVALLRAAADSRTFTRELVDLAEDLLRRT